MFPRRVTHKSLLHPSKILVWIFHKPCLCFLLMSCLNTRRPIPSTKYNSVYLLDITRGWMEQRCLAKGRRRSERSPSLQGPDINQTNYGATTISNPWRGNEMIRGRSQLNTERVNENINYLMIYWESGALLPPQPPTAESICFNWVIIRLLHLAESLDLSG